MQIKAKRIGVFGIHFNRGFLLVKRRDKPIWNLPGGIVEEYETPDEAMRREIREELGAKVRKLTLANVYYKPHRKEVVITYVVDLWPFVFRENDEAVEIKYFTRLPKNLFESHKERIKDVKRKQPRA